MIAVVGVLVALQYLAPNGGYDEVDNSQMTQWISSGQVDEIQFVDGDQQIKATLDPGVRSAGDKVTTYWLDGTQNRLESAAQAQYDKGKIKDVTVKVSRPSIFGSILATLLPMVAIVLVFLFLMNQAQGGGRGIMQFAKSKAKLISKDMPKTTFGDVAGCEEAIEELGEIKEFLQEP
ncbi:MAG: ATP-dependent metallopeptidase FtsH/Yme1/Tma family protein, partial [Nocardioides sp.]